MCDGNIRDAFDCCRGGFQHFASLFSSYLSSEPFVLNQHHMFDEIIHDSPMVIATPSTQSLAHAPTHCGPYGLDNKPFAWIVRLERRLVNRCRFEVGVASLLSALTSIT